jgi:hypothetical protein
MAVLVAQHLTDLPEVVGERPRLVMQGRVVQEAQEAQGLLLLSLVLQ